MSANVLVAHGNTQHLRQTVQALQDLGLAVAATPDGGDAFARFFEDSPDLVLCSVALPSLSGPNFARMVRSQSPETIVVLLGELSLDEDAPEGVPLLPDPLDVEQLRQLVPHLIPEAPPSLEDVGNSTASVFIQAALRRFQRDNNLLALMDERGLQMIAERAVHQVRPPNDLVIRQGDPGDGFYLLVEGQVRVTLEEKQGAEVARINPGGFFGEMALLHDQPRSATVWTVGPTTLLWFEKEPFLPVLDAYPVIREVLSGVALKRTEENLWAVLFDEADLDKSLDGLDDETDAIGSMELSNSVGFDDEEEPAADAGLESAIADELALGGGVPAGGDTELAFTAEAGLLGSDDDANLEALEDDGDAGLQTGRVPTGPALKPSTAPVPEAGAPAIIADQLAQLEARLAAAEARARAAEQQAAEVLARVEREARERVESEARAPEGTSPDITRPDPMAAMPAPSPPRTPWVAVAMALLVGLGIGAVIFGWMRDAPSTSAPELDDAVVDRQQPAAPDTERDAAAPELEPPPDPEPELEAPVAPEAIAAAPVGVLEEIAQAKDAATPEDLAERKRLRRALMDAAQGGRMAEALEVGLQLRRTYKADWEVYWTVAEAQRAQNLTADALRSYTHYFATYPDNAFADDARFHAAEILAAQGQIAEARKLWEAVAADASSNHHTAASQKLAATPPP